MNDIRQHAWWGPKLAEANTVAGIRRENETAMEEWSQRATDVEQDNDDTERLLDLDVLQSRVDGDHYKSVLNFHLDFQRVLDTGKV